MNLERPLDVVRLSLSSYCELRCSYCDQTGSKKSKAKPTSVPAAQRRIFACNSFYSEDLTPALEGSENSLIELHFLTLSMERHEGALQRLAALPGEWAALIDHWDTEKIKSLNVWDERITEYRIIPSERYSSDFFLTHLPHFILKKMKWQFLRKTPAAPALPTLSDVFSDRQKLPMAPLHDFVVADPKWDHTWSDQTVPLVQTEKWSAIDASKYRDSDWPLKLLEVTTPYVGYVNAPQALEHELRSPIAYFSTPAHASFQWVFGITEKPFYFLENFLVRKEIWAMYLRSTTSYNHWTWSAFIKSHNVQVVHLETSAPSQMTPESLRESLKDRCLKTGDEDFYSRHIFNIHPGRFFRQQSYTLFFIFLAFAKYWPKYFITFHKRATAPALAATQNLLHVFKAIYNHIPQWFWDGPWQWFWMKGPWMWFWSGPWKWFWSGPWKWLQAFKAGPWKWFWEHPVQLFWRGPWIWYWKLHHVFRGSLGFAVSLFDFPHEIRVQPRPRRWLLQSQFIMRKWGWLALKMLGRR